MHCVWYLRQKWGDKFQVNYEAEQHGRTLQHQPRKNPKITARVMLRHAVFFCFVNLGILLTLEKRLSQAESRESQAPRVARPLQKNLYPPGACARMSADAKHFTMHTHTMNFMRNFTPHFMRSMHALQAVLLLMMKQCDTAFMPRSSMSMKHGWELLQFHEANLNRPGQ